MKMATEIHRRGREADHKQKRKVDMDQELKEIREEMERLTLKMQQEAKVHWRYEWPLKRKAKWHVQKLLARRQQQVMRRWLREMLKPSVTQRKVVHICEPEVGKSLSDEEEKRSVDLMNCQEGRDEISDCPGGK
jgi:hypothetical protein